MKFLEKLSLTLFSMVILLLSLMVCLIIFNWLPLEYVMYLMQIMLASPTATKITLIVAVIFILLSMKCIFFPTKTENEKTEGILLENENGKLLISVHTIENLVKGVLAEFAEVTSANCKVMLDKQVNNVKVELFLVVAADTIIKEMSVKVQDRIKEVVKKTTELEIKEINIKIKDIETSKLEEKKK